MLLESFGFIFVDHYAQVSDISNRHSSELIILPSKEYDDEEFTTKVFTSDDRSLKLLGELLSNQVSRDIIRLLIEKEMYANEIANKLDIQFNLISHHLKKMGELGLLSVNEKRIVKKGQMHKYYKISPGIFLLPSHTKDRVYDKGILKKIFRDGIKFAGIGLSGIVSFLISNSFQSTDTWANPYQLKADGFLTSIIIGLIVVISGLIIYIKFKK